MAKLYATSPNGTAKSIQLETMNILSDNNSVSYKGWAKLPNGLIIQWANWEETRCSPSITGSGWVFTYYDKQTITFPISFVSNNPFTVCTSYDTPVRTASNLQANSLSTASVIVASNITAKCSIGYVAIGE